MLIFWLMKTAGLPCTPNNRLKHISSLLNCKYLSLNLDDTLNSVSVKEPENQREKTDCD